MKKTHTKKDVKALFVAKINEAVKELNLVVAKNMDRSIEKTSKRLAKKLLKRANAADKEITPKATKTTVKKKSETKGEATQA